MTELLSMDELRLVTATVDPEFTRRNSALSLSRIGGFRERTFGTAVAFQDLNRPESEYYNRVTAFGENEIPYLPEILQWYENAGLDCVVSLPQHAQSDAIIAALQDAGFRYKSSDSIYYVKPSEVDGDNVSEPFDVRMVRADSLGSLFELMRNTGTEIDANVLPQVRSRYCSPPFEFYIAFIRDEPVAKGSVFYHRGVAWLSNAVTDERYRGQGLHGVLVRERIRSARKKGCFLAVSDTQYGSASHRNLLRAGFRLGFTTAEMKLSWNS